MEISETSISKLQNILGHRTLDQVENRLLHHKNEKKDFLDYDKFYRKKKINWYVYDKLNILIKIKCNPCKLFTIKYKKETFYMCIMKCETFMYKFYVIYFYNNNIYSNCIFSDEYIISDNILNYNIEKNNININLQYNALFSITKKKFNINVFHCENMYNFVHLYIRPMIILPFYEDIIIVTS